jgi:Ca2+-binding RTX toxin-like protein
MAKYKTKKSKADNSPIKSLNYLNLLLDANTLENDYDIITQNSNTITLQDKSHKITYKGKFDYSNDYKYAQSSVYNIYSYNYYKLDECIKGVNFKIGETLQAVSSVKNANKFMSKLFKKNDTLTGGKANDKLWGYAGNDKISGGSGNDILCGGKGKDILIGGKGKDIFKLSKGKGYDVIQDFQDKQDKIFIGSMKKLKLKNKGKDVYIYTGKDLLAKVKGAKGNLSKKNKYLV